ncbi:uncharacterized membrane protein YkvA (DUF1232 family) [Litorivivens lipolytica]|uniref:Uncharacterized membrane protein YkvA (DUF1232 family) n=1 Tax=Litorivivens lipolytica TaxID=1524264 RepID=A0A7W4W2I4_9GAMM|nr:DUF1232 domain-containing protein [Litorivivens lipolytica]MBB3046267.1 uncharacterized membrane protein YkvA (DUF1232 family) [Litorivivens lipolytica]
MSKKRLEQDAAKVEKADVTRLLSRWPALQERIKSSDRLRPFLDDMDTAYSLLRDYSTRRYREIPWASIAAIVAALLYVLNPLDMIPDLLPIFGFIDDASILALCWSMVRTDLDKYRAFLRQQSESSSSESSATD